MSVVSALPSVVFCYRSLSWWGSPWALVHPPEEESSLGDSGLENRLASVFHSCSSPFRPRTPPCSSLPASPAGLLLSISPAAIACWPLSWPTWLCTPLTASVLQVVPERAFQIQASLQATQSPPGGLPPCAPAPDPRPRIITYLFPHLSVECQSLSNPNTPLHTHSFEGRDNSLYPSDEPPASIKSGFNKPPQPKVLPLHCLIHFSF